MSILLRRWTIEDAYPLAEYFSNPLIWGNFRDYIPFPYSLEDAQKFITTQIKITPIQSFAIVDGQKLVGGIGITLNEDIYRMNVELSYWVAEPFHRKGIASKAVGLMTDYVFNTFEINRIVAEVFEYNPASMRVLEKNGFFLETVKRKGILKNGCLLDDYIWVKQKIF
jgi:RimJ/RimL family protein N-acetyltransferase